MAHRKRNRIVRDHTKKVGHGPGSLVFVGEQKVDVAAIAVIDYEEENFSEFGVEALDELLPLKSTDTVTWINVTGVHDAELVRAVGERFDITSLTLEDVMNTTQRARIEEFDNFVYIVIRMLGFDVESQSISVEQVSLMVGANWMISFQEQEGDAFETVRQRLRNGLGRVRKRGSDYLAYALIDAIVDQYFVVLEQIGNVIEELEEEVLTDPAADFQQRLYGLKRQLVSLRRSVWPSRELASNLLRSESPLIEPDTVPFLRDVYDHSVQVIDITESYKDVVSNIGESYRSVVGNRMNEVMKVLTIIATIFIPLTFIAGIYGMNFEYMPELQWPWAYFMALFLMAAIGIALAGYFKAKKWF